MTQLLHNIAEIYFIEADLLHNAIFVPGVGVALLFWRNFRRLPLPGLGSYEVVSKVENNSTLFTHTLTALLPEHFVVESRHPAFLLKSVDGCFFLLGRSERPFPVVNTTDTFPGRVTDASGCTLSVEWTDTLGLMPVIDPENLNLQYAITSVR